MDEEKKREFLDKLEQNILNRPQTRSSPSKDNDPRVRLPDLKLTKRVSSFYEMRDYSANFALKLQIQHSEDKSPALRLPKKKLPTVVLHDFELLENQHVFQEQEQHHEDSDELLTDYCSIC